MQIKVGNYTGNGTSQGITGVGFQPDFVLVKDTTQEAIWSTANMGAGKCLEMTPGLTFRTDGITSLDSDGFHVGSGAYANSNTVRYDYVCIRDNGAGDVKIGSYTGTGVDANAITVGFQPIAVLVQTSGNSCRWRTADMAANNSARLSSQALTTNWIENFASTNFTVGTDASVNTNATTYYYIAFKAVIGLVKNNTYTGTGASNPRTGLGFAPQWVVLKHNGASNACQGFSGLVPTVYEFSTGASQSDRITSLDSDGYTLGADADGLQDANANGQTYYGFALRSGAATGGSPLRTLVGAGT